jgi:dipeptidyl aminopeptidase/acylaminoacyl peptidase
MDGRITLSRDIATLSNPLVNIVSGETTALHWKSFDGLAIDGYLTLPVQRKRGPYPLVVILHGGPARVRNSVDTVEWPGGIYFVELLAQRGFAVFEPDYRASGNFGFKFILQERARQDPFKENFADIASGITMLEKRGIADPSKLYLLGHSYGSTETNWIITHDTRFRAAISYEGLDYFYDWSRLGVPDTNMGWWLGDSSPLTQPKVWAANSAVLSTAHVSTPTLFIATEKGINSPSMLWLSGALLSKGIDTQYLLYRGEPHVIIQPANQRDLIQRILRWLKEH